MSDVIVNKVAESALVTVDLEAFLPKEAPMVFDLKDYLFMGLILKEKEFREALKTTDWEPFKDKTVLVTCSADAIVPVWAYMLVASYLQPQTNKVYMETEAQWKIQQMSRAIQAIDETSYTGKRIVVKGCGDEPIPAEAYLEITKKLQPVAKSIMYGEPCSTVPIFKQK
ncbi:MAG TPA: DUF2480 family protein [Lacibacter sp.]|nr:DUF2480 family protein [Lacibacter sp.]